MEKYKQFNKEKFRNTQYKNEEKSNEELELLRRKDLIILFAIIIGGLIISIFFLIFRLYIFSFAIAIGTMLTSRIVYQILYDKLKWHYKNSVVSKLLLKCFPDLTYDPFGSMDLNKISDCQLIRLGNHYISTDFIKSEYKKMQFEFANLELKDTSKNSTITIFKGQWIITQLPIKFEAIIQMFSTNLKSTMVKKKYDNGKNFTSIDIKEEEYRKLFNGYFQQASDLEKLPLLKILEKLKLLANKCENKIMLCIINDKLNIGIDSSKFWFNPDLFNKIDNIATRQNEIELLIYILEFSYAVNELLKNER